MPKFRFDFIEGMPELQSFADMPDRDQAGRETKRAAKQTMLDGADPTSWVATVYDEAGYLSPPRFSGSDRRVREFGAV
jgi:hypothetical protein